MHSQTGKNRERKGGATPSTSGSKESRRLALQLAGALLILGIWITAVSTVPETASQWGSDLNSLLERSWDLRGAFTQLGEQLKEGEDPVSSVSQWCISVFLPEEITVTNAENS